MDSGFGWSARIPSEPVVEDRADAACLPPHRSPLEAVWSIKSSQRRVEAHIAKGKYFDVLSVWRERAANVNGKPVAGRHFLPEEAPDEVLLELQDRHQRTLEHRQKTFCTQRKLPA
jgi:hypothetical protein